MAKNKQPEIENKEPELLTEEQYTKRERLRKREKVNRVTRIAGFFAILMIAYTGIYDSLFELSYFGWIFKKDVFNSAWQLLSTNGEATIIDKATGEAKIVEVFPVFNDFAQMGTWLPALAITVVLIAVTVFLIYFLTYNIIDFIEIAKTIKNDTKGIATDLGVNINYGINKKKKKDENSDDSGDKSDGDDKKEDKKKKKDTNKQLELDGYSSEQLDALLRGETIEDAEKQNEDTKTLF